MRKGLLVDDFLGDLTQIFSRDGSIENVLEGLGDGFEANDDPAEGLPYTMLNLYVRAGKSLACSLIDSDLCRTEDGWFVCWAAVILI